MGGRSRRLPGTGEGVARFTCQSRSLGINAAAPSARQCTRSGPGDSDPGSVTVIYIDGNDKHC